MAGDINSLNLLVSAVNKAYKTLENEEGIKRCREIIDEAKDRVNEMVNYFSENISNQSR